MWHASTDTPPPIKKPFSRCSTQITYLSSGLVVSLCRRDLLSALVSAGCSHLAIKIFSYLGKSVRLSKVDAINYLTRTNESFPYI